AGGEADEIQDAYQSRAGEGARARDLAGAAAARRRGDRWIVRRRILAVVAGLLAAPLLARAQQARRVWRIGFLYNGSRQSAIETGRYPAFLGGMRALGYQEGKDFLILERLGGSKEGGKSPPQMGQGAVRAKGDGNLAG